MSYSSLYDLKLNQPVFYDSSYGDKPLIGFIKKAAAKITRRLAKQFPLPLTVSSTAIMVWTGNAAEDEVLILGNDTYRFKATPSAINDIDIGADAAASALNLVRAVIESEYATGHYTGTTINTSAEATLAGLEITFTAHKGGAMGNEIPLSTTITNASVTAFSGGLREFPDLSLLNEQMATLMALGGQRKSMAPGGNVPTGIDNSTQIKEAFKELEKGGYLIDSDGVTYASHSKALDSDSGDYPPTDMQTPEHWGHDDARDWERP